MKVFRLSAKAKNLADEEPADLLIPTSEEGEEVPPLERALRVLVEEEGEVLATSDLAFYLVFTGSASYLPSATLYGLLTSGLKSRIVNDILRDMRGRSTQERVALAVAILSDDAPFELFNTKEEVEGVAALGDAMIRYAETSGSIERVDVCRTEGVSDDVLVAARAALSPLLKSLELLGVENAKVGVVARSDRLEPCVSVEGVSFLPWPE